MREKFAAVSLLLMSCSEEATESSAKQCAEKYISQNHPYYRFDRSKTEVAKGDKFSIVRFHLPSNMVGGEAEVWVSGKGCKVIKMYGSQ